MPEPGSGNPNLSTWWLVFSNAAFGVPVVMAAYRRDVIRALGFAAIMCVSAIYHYAHDTEHQPNREAWYNGFTEQATWKLSKADTILSVWAACAGTTLLVPLRHRTGNNEDGEVDRVVDIMVLFLGGAGVVATVEWAGYEKCPSGFEDCSSNLLALWYVLTAIGALAIEVIWALLQEIPLGEAWRYRMSTWGSCGVWTWLFSIAVLTSSAITVYLLNIDRAWHGLWHVLAAAALALALAWSSKQHFHHRSYRSSSFSMLPMSDA